MVFTYLVTGANRGIGFGIVQELVKKDNVKVIASARNPSTATDLQKLAKETKRVEVIELDVSSEESVSKLPDLLQKISPDGVDFLIGNAGIDAPINRVIDTPLDTYTNVFNTNVLGNILVLKALYPFLSKKDTKKVAFISSSAGSLSQFMPFPISAYGMSKASLNFLTKSFAFDHKDEGFTFVAVSPGLVDTDMARNAMKSFPQEFVSQVESITPAESASSMVHKVYDVITVADSGKFYSYDGTEYPL